MGRCLIDQTRSGLYGTVAQRIFGSNSSNWTNCNYQMGNSSLSAQSAWKTEELKNKPQSLHNHKFWQSQSSSSLNELNPVAQLQAKVRDSTNVCSDVKLTTNLQEWKTMKRKATDCSLDLDLSLKLTPTDDDNQRSSEDSEVDSKLSLSLYSPSSSKLSRLKAGGNGSKGNAKRTSTLDLTI